MGRPEDPHPLIPGGVLPLSSAKANIRCIFALFIVFLLFPERATAQPEVEELLEEIKGMMGLTRGGVLDPSTGQRVCFA